MYIIRVYLGHIFELQVEKVAIDQVNFTWRRGKTAPACMTAEKGAAVVHGNTAYFSQNRRVYSYTLASDEWTKLQTCDNERFGLAVVNDKVTAIGGWNCGRATNTLLSLDDQGTRCRELLPPMPTARARPGAVTTPTHLIIAGGQTGPFQHPYALSTIEILDTNTLQWSSASSSPQALQFPHMSLCGEHLYLSQDNTIFSCSVGELLKSCKPVSTNSSAGESVWAKLADIPVPYGASLTTLRGQVLTIGGSDQPDGGTPTGAIHQYNRSTDSWSVIGEMPSPRSKILAAALPSNELIAVGGNDGANKALKNTEIASTD